MDIKHKEYEDGQGRFYVEKDGQRLAILTYRMKETGTIEILHTEVDDSLRGQNIGYELVRKAADYAREKHLKVIPSCAFAASLFKRKKDEFADVVYP